MLLELSTMHAIWIGVLLIMAGVSSLAALFWGYTQWAEARRTREEAELAQQLLERELSREVNSLALSQEDRERQNRIQAQQEYLAGQERLARERAAFLALPRHNHCTSCQFVFPISLVQSCPKCDSTKIDSDVLAYDSEPRKARKNLGGISDAQLISLDTKIESKCELDDFIGLGNLILEIALRPDQAEYPDILTGHLEDAVRVMIARKFNIPVGMGFCEPHADFHLPHALRGDWSSHRFPQLLIFAYVLGASWKTLPDPHAKLLPYYRLLAERQTEQITLVQASAGPKRFRVSDL